VREPLSQKIKKEVSVAQRNPERFWNQLRNPAHQTGNNPGLNSGLLQEAAGEFDQLPTETP
jgi:hypothetical protein